MQTPLQKYITPILILLFSSVALIAPFESPVLAKGMKKASKSESADQQKRKAKEGNEPVTVKKEAVATFLDALEFFGRVEKPQAIFFIPGKDPKVDDISIDRKFFKEIFRIVERSTLKIPQKDDAKTHYIPY